MLAQASACTLEGVECSESTLSAPQPCNMQIIAIKLYRPITECNAEKIVYVSSDERGAMLLIVYTAPIPLEIFAMIGNASG